MARRALIHLVEMVSAGVVPGTDVVPAVDQEVVGTMPAKAIGRRLIFDPSVSPA